MKKKICTIIFFLVSFSGFTQTNYYVRTDGNDANTGLANTAGGAWKTVRKASVTVTGSNIINVGVGTFNEPLQLNFAVNVSITGVDSNQTKLVLSFYDSSTHNGAVKFESFASLPAANSQYIRNMWLDGNNLTAYSCLLVKARKNVEASGLKITNFRAFGAHFNGSIVSLGTVPPNFSTGNSFTNSTIKNCGDRAKVGGSCILIAAQDGMIVDNCQFDNRYRAVGQNGNCLTMVAGNNKGLKIYNSRFYKPIDEGATPNFAIESWRELGGYEVYRCYFNGGGNLIDAGTEGSVKDTFAYNWWVHETTFEMATQLPTSAGKYSIGFQFEDDCNGGLIEYNTFKNLGIGVMISNTHAADVTQNHTIRNNLFENMGIADGTYAGWGAIYIFITASGGICRDLNIYNNTIISKRGKSGLYLSTAANCFIKNVKFINNIVTNVANFGYITFAGANTSGIDSVFSRNNISFNNTFSNNPYYVNPQTASTVTNFFQTSLLKVDPLFVSTVPVTDYHLRTTPAPGSPGISNGLFPPSYTNTGYYIGCFPVTITNAPPIADAGTNKNITLPVNFFTQVGSGTDPDGTISSYSWSRISGPGTFNIVSPTSATTDINNLVAGTYVFQLTVTDNLGSTGSDQMTVVVNPTVPANIPPTASAGGNKNITLPTNSVTQVGSGTDTDGSITGYSWAYSSGPATYTIVSPTSATTVINNLVAGVYQFTLTVTDDDGATGSATATIIVNSAANVNPSANAGSNQTLTYPTVSTTLSGSGSDPDGTITGYSWAKISGAGTITSSGSASTTITGLVVGVSVFRLTVIDNSGGTATDDIQITVNKGSATIGFSAPSLSQVYTGLPLSPTVITSPVGLSYSLTLAGTTGGKTNVGSYPAIAGITDPNWTFTPASNTFTITKATAVISATSKTVNFDGNPQSITATTSPNVTGLTYLYNGSATPPTAIGVYSVDISLVNANYQATPVNVTLTIVSNPAIIFISDTVFVHDGLSHNVTVTSAYSYTLVNSPHTQAGVYPNVIATINDGIHTGADTATMTITKRAAILTWVQPNPIPYGSVLTTSILNATADISGTWTYSYGVGTLLPIGVTSVTATFTPMDTTNKTGGSITRSISVFGVNPFLDYFISSNGKFFFIEQ